ncbi:MAG: hypothetical protein IIZ67_03515 [Bacilli bacterium]|nr:hypothetical protein [Bacilli bacterium]
MKKEEKNFLIKTILLSIIISLVLFLPLILMYIVPNALSLLQVMFLSSLLLVLLSEYKVFTVFLFIVLLISFFKNKTNKLYNILNKIISLLCALLIIVFFITFNKDDGSVLVISYFILVLMVNVILISIYDFLLNYNKSSKQENNEQLLENKDKTINDTSNEQQFDSKEKQ